MKKEAGCAVKCQSRAEETTAAAVGASACRSRLA